MFAYLFVKINIKFIIRQFTLIVFTIFTPIVAIFWIINKRTIASSIWFGQIVINAFMQFVYTFLFFIYLTFCSASAKGNIIIAHNKLTAHPALFGKNVRYIKNKNV